MRPQSDVALVLGLLDDGSSRKHRRRIAPTDWQGRLVASHVEPFNRGLIHSDGRIVATERKGKYVRRAARYAFRNRSEDILRIFGDACVGAGVHCTRSSQTQIAIYSKAAVARLDEFVGPKSEVPGATSSVVVSSPPNEGCPFA